MKRLEQMEQRSKILVVDDDADIREQMKWALSPEYSVLEAGDDGVKLIGTAYFEFPQGTIVARGLTSVRPTFAGHGSDTVTHGTTAIPAPGENSVLAATGAFAGLEASVRLGGAVNLSNLASANEITFDCLFTIRPL